MHIKNLKPEPGQAEPSSTRRKRKSETAEAKPDMKEAGAGTAPQANADPAVNQATAETDRTVDKENIEDSSTASPINLEAATWSSKQAFPDGPLSADAKAAIEKAERAFRPAQTALKRALTAHNDIERFVHVALEKTFKWVEDHRDRPEVVNGLLEEKRIKVTAPVRANIYLAASKLLDPDEKPEVHSRRSGALAHCAAIGCKPDTVAEYLKRTTIAAAAEQWKASCAAAKPTKDKPKKPEPIEILRGNAPGVVLPPETPTPPNDRGKLFVVIVEKSPQGLEALAQTDNEPIVKRAIQNAASNCRSK